MPMRTMPRAAARERASSRFSAEPFGSAADVESFFAACDAREGAGVEPDWKEHLAVISESRARGVPTPPKRFSTRESRHER